MSDAYRDDLPGHYYYELIINDYEAYEANVAEARKLSLELSKLLEVPVNERTLAQRLEFNRLRKQVVHLEVERKEIQKRPMSTAQQLADKLHSENCHREHSDQCGYYYETSWKMDHHAEWLTKAKKLVESIGEEEAVRLLALYEQKSGIQKEINRVANTIKQLKV